MKKSHLSDLFSEESSSSDKSLLAYHRPHQPGASRTSSDSPLHPAALSSAAKHIPVDESPPAKEKSQESSPDARRTSSPSGSTASTSDAGGAPELLHSCIVSAFTFSGSQSVSLGSLGCALYWEPSRRRSLLILYRSRQQQVGLLTLTPTSLPAVQPRLYASFQCDAGKQFSVHLASQAALKEFAMKTVLAAALASAEAGGRSPVGLPFPAEDETSLSGGRRARNSDSLQLEVTEWTVQSPRSESLRLDGMMRQETSTLDSSWRSALGGARPGQRWVIGDPASLEIVREVLVAAVRPRSRQAPLQLPTEDGPDWRLGDDGTSSALESPPSPPSSPSVPAPDAGETLTNARGNTEEEPDTRDVSEEGENTTSAPAPSKGRGDVLARMARLGQQMFPSAAGAALGRSPSPPASPPPSPARRSSAPSDPSSTTAAAASSALTTAAAVTAETAESVAVEGSRVSAGSKPAVASRPAPGRLPSAVRPPLAARPDSAELGALLGRLEVKLEKVLSRLEPPAGVDADAETLAAGVRRLAVENAALRETSRKADQSAELRLEAERARAALSSELADSLAELAESRRTLAETRRRLAAAEEAASEATAAAAKREAELESQLAAAQSATAAAASAATTAAANSSAESAAARATREPRKVLKGVYKTLRSRLPAEATFTGAQVGEMVAEVIRETLLRIETETETAAGRTETQTETPGEPGPERGGVPPFVTEDECVEKCDE